jgi:4-hydroxy-tetrahydrodipicolinate synthase
MPEMSWAGVMPAITTPFHEDSSVDLEFLAKHCAWLVDRGAAGIIPLGSLGEGATLSFDEKVAVLETCVDGVGGRVPVVSAVSALSTREAVDIARAAERAGCGGLMVLPPYVHKGPWYEIRDHFSAVLEATPLPAMIYNNPIAYGTDLKAEHVAALAERHPNVAAVKESSGDTRRVTALKALLGDRLALFVGLDDMIVEGVAAGAVGWVAGLVNALPEESVELFRLARAGRAEEAFALYRWFLPLLRLDTVPEFVQLIKLVQQEVGMGSERVRPPRQPIAGEERRRVLDLVRERFAERRVAA